MRRLCGPLHLIEPNYCAAGRGEIDPKMQPQRIKKGRLNLSRPFSLPMLAILPDGGEKNVDGYSGSRSGEHAASIAGTRHCDGQARLPAGQSLDFLPFFDALSGLCCSV